jgi:hypothetical protein
MLQIKDSNSRPHLPALGSSNGEGDDKRQLAAALVQHAITTARNNLTNSAKLRALQNDDDFDDDLLSDRGSSNNLLSVTSESVDLNGRFIFNFIKRDLEFLLNFK